MFSYAKATVSDVVETAANTMATTANNAKEIAVDSILDVKNTVVGAAKEQHLVDEPTPEANFFTPPHGWPEVSAHEDSRKWQPPDLLMPLQSEFPEHFPKQSDIIGELKIEVLQATGLPKLMQFGRMDPYAVLLFEGCAARSATDFNSRNPMWVSSSARGFKFPVTCPFSILYIALKDEDNAIYNYDDDIGWVAVELNDLRPSTLYDCNFPLQSGNPLKNHKGGRGLLRLRISVTYRSDQARLGAYLNHTPLYCIPFVSDEKRSNSTFAYRGKAERRTFRWEVLTGHINEMREAVLGVVYVTKAFFFYKSPFLSIFICILWQVAVSHPWVFLGSPPLVIFGCLVRNYLYESADPEVTPLIISKPTVVDVFLSLFGRRIPPLIANARDHEHDDDDVSEGDVDTDEEDDEKAKKRAKKKDKGASSMMPSIDVYEYAKKMSDVVMGSEPGLDQELTKLKLEVEEQLEEEWDGEANASTEGFGYRPFSSVLGPVQMHLGKVLVYVRMSRRIMGWDDRILSLQLSVALLILAALLIGLGYLLSLIPWGWVFHIFWRLFGLAVFGPHMYWVGKHVEGKQAEWKARCARYDGGTDDERDAILAEVREQIEAERRPADRKSVV